MGWVAYGEICAWSGNWDCDARRDQKAGKDDELREEHFEWMG